MPSETIELRGHIIDSLILPKVLDQILTRGADFKIIEIKIGQNRVDQSFAKIEVTAPSDDELKDLILRLLQHGAEVVKRRDVSLAAAPADGIFPFDFYVTTNQQTFVRLKGKEIEVRPATMDSAIAIEGKFGPRGKIFRCAQRHANRGRSRRSSGGAGCSAPIRNTPMRVSIYQPQHRPRYAQGA